MADLRDLLKGTTAAAPSSSSSSSSSSASLLFGAGARDAGDALGSELSGAARPAKRAGSSALAREVSGLLGDFAAGGAEVLPPMVRSRAPGPAAAAERSSPAQA